MKNASQLSYPRRRSGLWIGLSKLGGVLVLISLSLGLSGTPERLVLQPIEPGRIKLALLGDLMVGRGVAERFSGVDDHPLALLAGDLKSADLALANLESPLTSRPLVHPDGYDLRADPAKAFDLAQAGLDILSLANNHSLDSGPAGLADTRDTLLYAGLLGVTDGDQPLRLELNGLKVSILGYQGVTQPLDLAAIERIIRQEKENGAVVIVSLHWGIEFRPAPEPYQIDTANSLAQAGADLIWGHHPHVLQPVAWLPRPEPHHPALVFYSLGNSLFDQETPPDARWGALMFALLDQDGVTSLEVRPFEIDLRNGGIQEPDAETAHRIRERLKLP